jgi:transcriptional regulator with XRE-family HTH domain
MGISTKTYFHTNIKFLREKRGLTQAALCKELNIVRNKLQALESGKTINPVIADIVNFAIFYGISIDSLIRTDLSSFTEKQLSHLIGKSDDYFSGAKMRVLAISTDKVNNENIEYVPIKARAGYQAGFNDPEFIAALPKFSLPNLPPSGTFRIFPTVGKSMSPIPENSEIIGEYVVDWKTLKPDTPCVVILNGAQEIVFKLLTIQEGGKVLLKSLNADFKPYQVEGTEVLEVWKYFKHQTAELPVPNIEMNEIKEMILELSSKIEAKNWLP